MAFGVIPQRFISNRTCKKQVGIEWDLLILIGTHAPVPVLLKYLHGNNRLTIDTTELHDDTIANLICGLESILCHSNEHFVCEAECHVLWGRDRGITREMDEPEAVASGEEILGPLHWLFRILDGIFFGRLNFLFRSASHWTSWRCKELRARENTIQGTRLHPCRSTKETFTQLEHRVVVVEFVGGKARRLGGHDKYCSFTLVPFIDVNEFQVLRVILLYL